MMILGVRNDSGKLIALAPLVKERVRWRGLVPLTRVRLLGTGENEADEVCSEYLDVIVDNGAKRSTVITSIISWMRSNEDWDEMVIEPVARESSVYQGLQDTVQRGLRVRELAPSSFIPLPGTWDDFLNDLSSSQRSRIRKTIRELEKKGSVGLEVARMHQEPGPIFDKLVELHQGRWNRAGKPGVFASPRFLEFHRSLISRLQEKEGVFLAALTLDQNVIGCLYCLVYGAKVYFYQSGIDLDISANNSRIKPGLAVHALAIKHLIDKGITEYDFLAGDNNNYKSQWTKHRRNIYQVLITRDAVKMHLISLIERTLGAARRMLAPR
jgi:hypothetical protein